MQPLASIAPLLVYNCVLLRGLPGSGKSTLAQRLVRDHGFRHFEADQHFMVDGVYRFDPARVADAHAIVARDSLAALQAGDRVVVANTHVRLWELAAAVGAARLSGHPFCVVECSGQWGNVHAVPADAIQRMRERWEPLPAEFGVISFMFAGE
ncbi:MAG: AAA family ATPase [Burkholderiales bacterium]